MDEYSYSLVISAYNETDDGDVYFTPLDDYDYNALKETLENLGEVFIIEEREDSTFVNGAFNTLNLELLETFFDDYKYDLTIAG